MSTTGSRPLSKVRNTALLGIAALVLMAVVGLSYREWRHYSRANADAARTRAIVDATDRLLTSLIDAETGQRGFLLTGEDRYLEPYNRAIQEIPAEFSTLSRLLAARPDESARAARLNALTADKLGELSETIELRRVHGLALPISVVLSERGKQTMDEIRATCAQVRQSEISSQSQASTEGEAAAGTALMATIVGSLVLLFLFAFGLEPFASPDPQAQRRSWPLRYGAAVLAVVLMALFRTALTPIMGDRSMPFTLFFPAVWFAAWFGGLRPGALSVVLSGLAGAWFFAEPTRSLLIRYHDDQAALLMLVIVGFGMALLSRSQRGAVDRALRAESSERNERQRFETTLTSIGDAVIATDAQGRVTFANRIALSLLRRPQAEVTGKQLDEVFHIINEFTRAAVESPVARVLREGVIAGLANHTVLIAADGTEVPIDDSAAPIRSGDDAMQGAVLVFRDITERRRAEAASRLTNEALARANEDLNQFAFAASHDLQEPLRMITAYSQLLVKGYRGQLDGEATTCIDFITEGTKRMRELLADLLTLTQVTGDDQLPLDSIDLNQVFENVLDNCTAAIEETSAVVTRDRLPTVPGRETQYIQLLQNLISNALKYRGEQAPYIHVSAVRQNGMWRFAVADNGMGIAPQYHEQIFGVFKRLHGKTISGTGIGLAICQRIVERHGGRIWVESQERQGATFYFTLPAAKGAAAHE